MPTFVNEASESLPNFKTRFSVSRDSGSSSFKRDSAYETSCLGISDARKLLKKAGMMAGCVALRNYWMVELPWHDSGVNPAAPRT